MALNGPARAALAAGVAAVAFLGVGGAVMALQDDGSSSSPTTTSQEVRPVADIETTTTIAAPTTAAPTVAPPAPVAEQAPEEAPADPGPVEVDTYTTPNGPEGPPQVAPVAPLRSVEENGGAPATTTTP